MTRTLVWVKIPKLCHKNPTIYLFLGKGRESFISDFIKNQKNLVRFLPCPPARKIFQVQALCGQHTPKIHTKLTNKIHFLQILHLSSNRRVCNLTLYFQFTTPAGELTHRMKFEYPGRHEFQTRHVSLLP